MESMGIACARERFNCLTCGKSSCDAPFERARPLGLPQMPLPGAGLPRVVRRRLPAAVTERRCHDSRVQQRCEPRMSVERMIQAKAVSGAFQGFTGFLRSGLLNWRRMAAFMLGSKREKDRIVFSKKPVTAGLRAKRIPPRYPPARSIYVDLSDPRSTGEQRYGRGLP